MPASPRLLLPMALLGLGACFNPDDIFPLRGSLSSQGELEGQRVELLRERRTAVYGPCAALEPFLETTADAEGQFVFDVFRVQAQSLLGNRGTYCFRAQTTFASGASVSLDVPELAGELTLPPFPDWSSNLGRDGGFFSFTPVQEASPGDNAALVVHRLEVRTPDGGLAWRADDVVLDPDAGTPLRVQLSSERVALEEFTARASLQARVLPREVLATGAFPSALPIALYAHAAGALELETTVLPWSWRAGCPAVAEPCPLTDHRLAPVELGGVATVRVDLSAPTVPVAVVLRGFVSPATSLTLTLIDENNRRHVFEHPLPVSLYANDVLLETSSLPDGGHISTLHPEPRFTVIPLDVNYWVDSFIVTFPGGVERLSELSVF